MTTYSTYGDVFRPAERNAAVGYDVALVVGGSLLIALSAQLAIWLPFSPVPVTGQTLAVLLVGVLLGSKRGAAAVLAYLAQGAVGLPVFAGGTAGAAVLMGPTGGYLAGFVLAGALVGRLAEAGWDRHWHTTSGIMLLGNAIIYACGLLWLAQWVGYEKALPLGLYPYLVGDLFKIGLATLLLPLGWKLIGSRKS
jgi:biotin transport system substrate-specific component